MFAEEVPGLGIVVTITTRFDPNRIRERLTHWLEKVVEEFAVQVREEINKSGVYYPDENSRERRRAKKTAIEMGMKNLNWVVTSAGPSGASAVKAQIKIYGMMAGKLALSYVLPWVGVVVTLTEFLVKKKKKPYPIPWNEIYSQALPYAKTLTNQEELERIEKEKVEIEDIRQKEITRVSHAGAMFKLPEGVTSVSKGALVMSVSTQPRIIDPKKEVKPESVKTIQNVVQIVPKMSNLPVVR